MASPIPFPPHIAALKAYIPGRGIGQLASELGIAPERIAKLASNENPLGASPLAIKAMADAAIDVSRYPDNDCTALVAALAQRYGVPPDWVVVGAGSESLLGIAAATLLTPGRKTLYPQYSFQAFVNAAQRLGAMPIVAAAPELAVDLGTLTRGLGEEPALVYLANPGNPTGTCLDPDSVRDFLARVPPHVVMVLDEAYFEFMPAALRGDSIALVRNHPNLLLTRTFSKAYGLAGLRVGYGIAQPALADMLRRVRPPFTVSDAAQAAAVAALHDEEFLRRTLTVNAEGLHALQAGLETLGFSHLPSSTNFVLTEVGDGAAWSRRLEREGFIVRPVGNYGLPGWLRISVGTPAEVSGLLSAMAAGARNPT